MVRVLTVIALVAPLALDTFAVSVGLGAAGATAEERKRASALFTLFEAVMPVLGFAVGSAAAMAVGQVSEYAAGAVLSAIGLYMLWPDGNEETEYERLTLLARARGPAILVLGLSISLDELAIGFAAGLLGISVLILVPVVAVQAFVASQLGVHLGARVKTIDPNRLELVAGGVLVTAGGWVILGTVIISA
jgi:manganese efflux pump family protein